MAAETDNAYLRRCFDLFPAFFGEFDILLESEVITMESSGCYVWNYSKTSLAEYFGGLNTSDTNSKNRKWNPIECAFYLRGEKGGSYEEIEKGSLRHLYSSNGRIFKDDISLDTEKIFDILAPYHKRLDDEKKERAEQEKNNHILGEIKNIIAKTDEKKSDDVKEALRKIKNYFSE